MENDCPRVAGDGPIDQIVTFMRTHGIARVENGAKREEYVVGRYRPPVAPSHASTQLIANRSSVGREPAVATVWDFREEDRLRPAALVEIDERLEYQASDLLLYRRGVRGQKEGVEVARIGGQIKVQSRGSRAASRANAAGGYHQGAENDGNRLGTACAEWICGVIVMTPNILR